MLDQQDPKWQAHKQQLENISLWEAKGKIAASHEGEGGNASFVWENDNDFYKIRMFGPFGAGSAELTGSSKQVIFEQGDGAMNIAKTPEALLYQQTGLNVPVTGLMFWIKGIPSPYGIATAMQTNEQGHLTYLEQSDWQVEIQKYKLSEGRWFPSQLNLLRNGTKVKIIIKQWTWKA